MVQSRNNSPESADDQSITDSIDRQDDLNEAMAQTGARPEDIERQRIMSGGETESTPEIPVGDLSTDEIANARETARGGLGAGPVGYPWNRAPGQDVGAPWDEVDDAARMANDTNEHPRG